MKNAIIIGVIATTFLLAGCGKKNVSSVGSAPSTTSQTNASSSPILPALTAWEQDDKATAVSSFLAADWNVDASLMADSTLNLRNDQFKSLTDAQYQSKSVQLTAQLQNLRGLATAVEQAGRDAALKGDTTQAPKCFMSLKQCSIGWDNAENLQIVQLVGQAMRKMSEKDLAKIGQ
jgi:PBP1b-binding outer membrane lipoprotein LpoB